MARLSLPFDKSDSFTASSIRQHVYNRIRWIILAFGTLLVLINVFTFREHIPPPNVVLNSIPYLHSDGPILQVALINAHHANDEVHTALLDALSHAKNLNITRYQLTSSFGMDEIVSQLPQPPTNPWLPLSEFSKLTSGHGTAPDIVVSTTCGNDYSVGEQNAVVALKLDYTRLLEHYNTHLICVMHQSMHFVDGYGFELKSIFKPWILAGRVDFLTLSPHVGEYFLNNVYPLFWEDIADLTTPVMRNFVPVFPLQYSSPISDTQASLKLAVQGSFDHGRDFESLFARFVHIKNEYEALGRSEEADMVELHVIGSGTRPDVPDSITQQVIFHQNLNYTDYYTLLSEMDAVLPAFAGENWGGNDYYSNLASSTISASIIAGVPLVADHRLRTAYSYLELSMLWYREDNEPELDAAFRILNASADKRRALKEAVARRRVELMEENYRNVKEWSVEAHEKARLRLLSTGDTTVEHVEEEEVEGSSLAEGVFHHFNPFPTHSESSAR